MTNETVRDNCVNCNQQLTGKFCHYCGQKKVTPKDKKLKYFIEEFFSSLFVADGKIIITFKYLLFSPGKLSQAYIKGNRKKYLLPLRVFFFANLLYFLFPFLNTFNTNLNTQLTRQFYSELASDIVTTHLEDNAISYEEYESNFESKSNNIGKLLLILLVVVQAFCMQLLFFRKKDLYFTDFLSASAYFTSFYILTFLVIFPFLVRLLDNFYPLSNKIVYDNSVISIILLIGVLAYLFIFLKRAFSTSKRSAGFGAIMLAFLLLPTIVFYRFMLFIVTHLLVI